MKNPYGYFSENGDTFVITNPDIPRNWYNYLFNDNYITFTSQVGMGEGFFQDSLGNRIKLVDRRAVYLVEGETFWLTNALPVEEKREAYFCTHGLGYTVIHMMKNGVASDYGLFVPNESDPKIGGEVAWVTLKNETKDIKTVKVISYVDTLIDGPYVRQGYNTDKVDGFDAALNGVVTTKLMPFEGNHVPTKAFLLCSKKATGYDCARNAFIGTYGDIVHPKALVRGGGCTNSACINEKMCFALQTEVTLKPGEENRIVFLCGTVVEEVDKVADFAQRFFDSASFDHEFTAMQNKYQEILQGVNIKTPDEEMNKLCNNWLMYLTNMGSRWARVRHNGYRDIVSDTECLATFHPTLAWERVKRILSYQYANGYAPRTFIDGKICDNNFADCTVWLTFTVYYIVNELGDLSLLDELVPFNDGSEASVYEHLKRSAEYLYHFTGHHGLIQIWGGDWNDCINTAGLEHKGVSIWLTMAWYRACKMFVELAEKLGKTEDAEVYRSYGEHMRDLVDQYGWDSEGYYIYGIDDWGDKIGGHECQEGKIHLNPQLWAVLSGISKNGKELIAFAKGEQELRTDLGCIGLKPAYTKKSHHLGSIAEKAPGVQENGGVYLHTIAWKIAVDGMLKRRDLIEKDICTMLPFRNPVVAGRGEPYMLFNSYCAEETGYRCGTPGQSWRTASGQWFVKAMINYVFGLMPTIEGLTVDPCLPESWKECSITKNFRKAVYNITYRADDQKGIVVDGAEIEGNLLPYEDGKTFEVVVRF